MQKNIQQDAVKRLKIIEGHLKKVIQMVSDDQYCIDILQQSLAVQSALKKVDEEILESHFEHCVSSAVRGPKKSQVIKEVVEIFKRGRN